MRQVTLYRTADGKTHEMKAQALAHASKRFHDAVDSLCAKLVQIQKITPMREFVESHLAAFAELLALQADTRDNSNDSNDSRNPDDSSD